MPPEKLYKYLPSKHAVNMLKNGELLFRNLTYFKQYEDKKRGDPLEGHHRENPDKGIVITNLSTGKKIHGDFSFLNSTDSDIIFVFCLSKSLNSDLYKEFNSDACLVIKDVDKFLLRTRMKLRHLISCHKSGLLHGEVKYYAANAPADFNIKEPKELAFAKDEMFKHQNEYRLVFGKKKAFKLEQSMVYNNGYDFKEEAMKGTAQEKMIRLGNISDIAHIQHIGT